MTRAFVTGSTGLLGSNLVRQLVDEGYEVQALARTKEKADRFLGDVDTQIVIGDMLDIPAFTPSLVGVDVLFHVAAFFKEYTGADDKYDKLLQTINVDGTIALFEAAKAQGVRNIVYTSSGGVIGQSANGAAADETSPFNEATPNQYFQSKIRAEKAIEGWLKDNPDMRVVLILPGAILGPGDNGPTGIGRMCIDVLEGNLPATPPGALMMVDVRDVATASIKAIKQGNSGDRFIVANRFCTMSELVPLVAKVGGVKAPAFNLPYPVAWMYGAGSELVAKITGQPPLATRVLIKTLNEDIQLSSAKAQRELGITYHPIEETVSDAITWFRDFGYV
ncbi:MAG: NAD-dependent epimerase/dehydratase family protein [Chloroflexota bacterium]